MEFLSTKCIWNFGTDRRYRFYLERIWDRDLTTIAFIGLNPSKADENISDNTVTRAVNFAKAWGYGGMHMLNAFAYRATDPRAMKKVADPVGVGNDRWIIKTCSKPTVTAVVLCWGTHAVHMGRNKQVLELLDRDEIRKKLCCFSLTKAGHPRHPLYLPNDTFLEHFKL